jgi:hypothetical protein
VEVAEDVKGRASFSGGHECQGERAVQDVAQDPFLKMLEFFSGQLQEVLRGGGRGKRRIRLWLEGVLKGIEALMRVQGGLRVCLVE